jgi:hypothetical protein
MNIEKKKRNIFDLLFIDRVDRVLAKIYSEVEDNCNKTLTIVLSKSLAMVDKVLQEREAAVYKANITEILSKKSGKK